MGASLIYNLRELAHVMGYMNEVILPDVRTAFEHNGCLHPFGVVFITCENGVTFNLPQPLVVGAVGMPPRVVKRTMQRAMLNLRGIGAIYARQGEFSAPTEDDPKHKTTAVVVQLEHQLLEADLAWTARVRGKLLDAFHTGVPLAVAMVHLKPTAFLPQRWMS